MRPQKMVVCRDGGANCDWEVRDSNEQEVLMSAQGHAKRRHALDLSVEQIRPLVRDVRVGVGGI